MGQHRMNQYSHHRALEGKREKGHYFLNGHYLKKERKFEINFEEIFEESPLFEEIMAKTFPNLRKETDTQI